MNPPSILSLPEPEQARMHALAEQAQRKLTDGVPLGSLSPGELLGYALGLEAALFAATNEIQRQRDAVVLN
jgi:hypothetical protein